MRQRRRTKWYCLINLFGEGTIGVISCRREDWEARIGDEGQKIGKVTGASGHETLFFAADKSIAMRVAAAVAWQHFRNVCPTCDIPF